MNEVFVIFDGADVRGICNDFGGSVETLFQVMKLDESEFSDELTDAAEVSKRDLMAREIFKQNPEFHSIVLCPVGIGAIDVDPTFGGVEFSREHSPTFAVQQAFMDVAEGEDYEEVEDYLKRSISNMIPTHEETMEYARDFILQSKMIGRYLGTDVSDALLGAEDDPSDETVNDIIDGMTDRALEVFRAKCEPYLSNNPGLR